MEEIRCTYAAQKPNSTQASPVPWKTEQRKHKAKQIPSMPWRWRLRRGLALNKDDHDDDDDDEDVKSSPKY